jgi:hypothetical protein
LIKNKIKFVINRPWLDEKSVSVPAPIIKTIPDWYRKADRFIVDPNTNSHWIDPRDGGKIPTWKACPAIFDIMGAGYTYRTPCDVEVKDGPTRISIEILDYRMKDFIETRPEMPQFVAPAGYHGNHFAWLPDWAVELPDGYSALYSQPFNRFELPFLTTSGIIDNDKVNLPGTMPFFIAKGFTGVIPAGTPYVQIFPFKRENWESNIETSISYESMINKNRENSDKYRVPNGGVYQKKVWTRRTYE